VREQVASAVDLVVHQVRRGDGSRAIESISEVVRVAGATGTRELLAPGGGVLEPGTGRLASRLAAVGIGA